MRFFGILPLLCLSSVAALDHKEDTRSLRASVKTPSHRNLKEMCSSPFVLDFGTKPDGTPLNSGDLVSEEWKYKYRLTITAEGYNGGGYTPDGKACVFDSSNPGVVTGLGSPNNGCRPNRGPGKGMGGRPGEEGENCVPQGNVLIIADSDSRIPADFSEGGIITFIFEKPTDVTSIGLMDINTSKNWVRVHNAVGGTTIRVPRRYNNSVQQVPINQAGITKIEVYFSNNGAITDLTFCHDDTVDDMDLGFRFNKVGVEDGMMPPGESPLPLTAEDFPLSSATEEWLSETQAVSVVRQETCFECDILTSELIASIGGLPTHPSGNPDHPFWDELLEVINVQIARNTGELPTEVMPIPKIWADMDIHDVAEAVHDEFPGVHHVDLLETFLGDNVKIDRNIIPSTNKKDFLRGPVALCDINAWAIGTVGPHNFGVKWFAGRARPEEVVKAIKDGDIPPEAVPEKVKNALEQLDFDKATEFTAYEEGSPRHPSWPAMHSAASAGSFWMALLMELTPEQWCEAKAVDYGVAYARTVAGVHFNSDNIAGLNLGQEILARKLPQYLATRYGSDPVKVKKKIQTIRFDWNNYLTSECFPDKMYS